jgi:hypothetical protein
VIKLVDDWAVTEPGLEHVGQPPYSILVSTLLGDEHLDESMQEKNSVGPSYGRPPKSRVRTTSTCGAGGGCRDSARRDCEGATGMGHARAPGLSTTAKGGAEAVAWFARPLGPSRRACPRQRVRIACSATRGCSF